VIKIGQFFYVAVFLLVGVYSVPAQTPAKPAEQARNNLIEATQSLKSSTEDSVKVQQAEVDKARTELAELRELVSEGLVARNELEASEAAFGALEAKLKATQEQVDAADQRIADIRKEEELAKAAPVGSSSVKGNLTKPTILRYSGPAAWSLAKLPVVQAFFSATFGRPLPTSAIGQSSTHNQLRWDHRNSVDVGLHPDSVEGKALISFLQSQGIPFLAFRSAIPGVATGPHIHIGFPSHRLG